MINIESQVYKELNKAWKSTCRVLLKDELGELKDYEDWLKEFYPNLLETKSHASGEDVTFRSDLYSSNSRFISMNEIKEKKIDPLNINEIKDIDSIIDAVSEKWEYAGNLALGRSTNLEYCDMATDSHYVMFGGIAVKSAYAFAGYDIYEGKNTFGSSFFTNTEFLIKFSRGVNNKRCFETAVAYDCSDLYYSHNCRACHELMFSFHQVNKRNCIGNLELPKERYQELKAKLISEIVDELKKKKRITSVYEMVPDEPFDSSIIIENPKEKREKEDTSVIEKAFSSTVKILFKKEPENIETYGPWLSKNIVPLEEIKTKFGSTIYHPTSKFLNIFSRLPKKRSVTFAEAMELSKLRASEEDIKSIEKAMEWASKYGSFTPEMFTGNEKNNIKSTVLYNSNNMFKSYANVNAEKCGFCSWALSGTKNAFGSVWMESSQFIMKCYYSTGLNRCFEVDASMNCADSYFCHNCEGLNDAMFCWNTKGKRYVIGNASLVPEQYRSIKERLVEQMGDEILKNKELRWDIYNIGAQ